MVDHTPAQQLARLGTSPQRAVMSHLQVQIQIPSPCLSMACGVTDRYYGAHDETGSPSDIATWSAAGANRLTAKSVNAYNAQPEGHNQQERART